MPSKMNLRKTVGRVIGERMSLMAKELVYGRRGEPFWLGSHRLRFVVGTRPVRAAYRNSHDVTARNDARQIEFFLNRVEPGDFLLDIGGHRGQYAVILAALAGGSGQVVSFEPDNIARKILLDNVALNNYAPRVTVEAIALSDSCGVKSFYSRGGDSMSSLARSGLGTNAHADDVIEQSVRTERLDDYITTRGLQFPKWIKLDTEGAEIAILRGAPNVLRSEAGIVCELHPYAWQEFGTSFQELLQIVWASGRTIRYLDESLRIENGPVYGAVVIS